MTYTNTDPKRDSLFAANNKENNQKLFLGSKQEQLANLRDRYGCSNLAKPKVGYEIVYFSIYCIFFHSVLYLKLHFVC